jgi:hypothetical protein
VLALVAVLAGSACDLIARPGETLTLADGGPVFGTGGNSQRAPLPAVRVRDGATVVVQNAMLFGGGTLVEVATQAAFGTAGPGISSDGGTVRVQQGEVRGGPILAQVASDVLDDPAPGIDASSSTVEISGGSVRGGSLLSSVTGAQLTGLAGSAIEAFDSTLRITAGTFSAGAVSPAAPGSTLAGLSLLATASDVEIRGGSFPDPSAFADSRVRILGGSMFLLTFLSSDPAGCAEVRGGQFSGLGISGGRVIVAGSGFALTSLGSGAQALTGTLEDGTRVNAAVVQDGGGQLVLVAPGAAGCP